MRTPRNRSVLTRISALLLAGTVTLLVSIPTPGQTEAGWIDPEYASASVTTYTVPSVLDAKCIQQGNTAQIAWSPPAGGLPAGMRYKITLDNDPPVASKQGIVLTGNATHPYSGSNAHPRNTPLIVRVYIYTHTSTSPEKVLWESVPATLRMNYTSPKYSCVNN